MKIVDISIRVNNIVSCILTLTYIFDVSINETNKQIGKYYGTGFVLIYVGNDKIH